VAASTITPTPQTWPGDFIEVLRIRLRRCRVYGALDVVVMWPNAPPGYRAIWISIRSRRRFSPQSKSLRKLAENLARGVNGAFEAFYLRPLAVSRHNFGRIIL
jgi:hypothetical protein